MTAIDTATVVMAFYPLKVEKILDRYQALGAPSGEFAVRKVFDEEELALLDEFLAHGHEVRAERARAAAAGEKPDFVPLMRRCRKEGLQPCRRRVQGVGLPQHRLPRAEEDRALLDREGLVSELGIERLMRLVSRW